MDGLVGPLFIAAALLVLAGVPKIAEPGDTTRAIRSVGLPAADPAVRLLAVVEVAIGIAVIAFGGPAAAAMLGLLYAAFAGFILLAMRRGGAVASCGCFGKDDTPPTYGHLLLNLSAAAVGIVAAFGGVGGLLDVLPDQPAAGIPFIGFVGLGAWFGYLVLTALPRLRSARTAG